MPFNQKYGCVRIGNKKFVISGGGVTPAQTDSVEESAEALCKERRARDREHFFGSFARFWEKRAEIAARPEIYGITPLFSGLSLAYAGGGPLSLGMLLELWAAGEWRVPCPGCGERINGRAENFAALWRPAKDLLARAEVKNVGKSEKRPPRPREDFRALSARWLRDYDEKSEAELKRAAAERKARKEAERARALEAERKKYAALGLSAPPCPRRRR
ncbi:hypothetical protein [Cloacibacillus sp. An23]|uniref:hypothetical protein n=1 Tax=Cloacibacillus sp. An23 TaxID=1965591 RepID=UPI0011786675|nr:hypothetical protein [Cloacibacillus sp. An23]